MSAQGIRVVVVGGALAGSAAALGLHRAGAQVVVCEADSGLGTDLGAFLTLAGNGMRALAQLGAVEPVSRAGFGLTGLSVLDENGTELVHRPMGEPDDPLQRYRCLRWSELTGVLQAEVRDRGIELRHGARLRAVTDTGTEVRAELTDGSVLTADLLVGADGLNSTVRALIAPQAAAPRYVGQRVFYGYTDRADPPTRPGAVTMVRGSRTGVGYMVSPQGRTCWFARQSAPAVGRSGPVDAQLRAGLLDDLSRDRTPAAALLEATDDLMVTDSRDLPGLDSWSAGRVVLIGDAAHAAAPATGQGASMAFEDAVILAKALREFGPQDAAARFEQVRRPRTDRNMAASAALSGPVRAGGGAATQLPPEPFTEEQLADQLDWHAGLPVVSAR